VVRHGAVLGVVLVAGCAPAGPPAQTDDAVTEPGSVGQVARVSCSTADVAGLSRQIIEEGNCVSPGAFSEVPEVDNLRLGDAVFAYLEEPARDALLSALAAAPSKTLTINSMLRTVAQQYLLHSWYEHRRCSIPLAAKPGDSNHETGLALDTSDSAAWRSDLTSYGFKWFGQKDKPHFDYVGPGAVSHKGVDIAAFQRLWNRNHPDDQLPEDGVWGTETASRMSKAPADGFPVGAQCDGHGGAGGSGAGGGPAGCEHEVNETGAALEAGCDPCAGAICAVDAFCCDTEWDATCVEQVATVCEDANPDDPPECEHDLCTLGAALLAECDPCADSVCAADIYCCETEWDEACVEQVATVCGESC
jgi:hypothetical protein